MKIKFNPYIAVLIVCLWGIGSAMTSFGVVAARSCDKDYPIGYIFYSKLFCELK